MWRTKRHSYSYSVINTSVFNQVWQILQYLLICSSNKLSRSGQHPSKFNQPSLYQCALFANFTGFSSSLQWFGRFITAVHSWDKVDKVDKVDTVDMVSGHLDKVDMVSGHLDTLDMVSGHLE